MLGTNEYKEFDSELFGVFQGSAVEEVRLPSTLKRIEYNAFRGCRNLKRLVLPDKLEYIGRHCFDESGIAEVVFPAGLRVVGASAFQSCSSYAISD